MYLTSYDILIMGTTDYFPIKQGCRQGDPLSAYLFIICVEVLFVQVRDNNEIIGITINDHEIKLSAFADDANFLVSSISSRSNLFLMHVQNFRPFLHSNLILKIRNMLDRSS